MNRLIVWHRRDLRIHDNTALLNAIKDADDVVPLFILDDDILLRRDDFSPSCVNFMLESLQGLAESYKRHGGQLVLRRGKVPDVLKAVVRETGARGIYFNEDYETFAKERDGQVKTTFEKMGLEVKAFTDQVCFKPGQILTRQGNPYTVFTPYKKNWLTNSDKIPRPLPPPERIPTPSITSMPVPTAESLGFPLSVKPLVSGGEDAGRELLRSFLESKLFQYNQLRDFPAEEGTSLLSAHLRFGTVSIREIYHSVLGKLKEVAPSARDAVETFVNELVWREFYFQILDLFPHVEKGSFKKEYDGLTWENREDYFDAWKDGQTGYPIVDAAMRQLNTTGWMHNRLRMIVASFLTKDLLIDWRWGEHYFMQKLIDGDLALNNGGWQWAASTGTDAQPYFRIFNPITQSKKFDPSGAFIRKFVPELKRLPDKFIHDPSELYQKSPLLLSELGVALGKDYPFPIVRHDKQREKALLLYKTVL